MPLGPITVGKDYNYFEKVTVASASFNSEPDSFFNIKGQQSFSLVNEGTGVIEYSYNGTTLHGDMTPSSPTAAIFFDNRRVSKIWFRLKSGAASVVRVEAWSKV